jgi:hypothetical protein
MRLAPGKQPLVTISACIPLIEVDRRECLRQPSRDAIPVCKRKQQIQPPVEVEEYLANLKLLGQAYREIFGAHYPAMALVQVVRLVEKAARVEIEGHCRGAPLNESSHSGCGFVSFTL